MKWRKGKGRKGGKRNWNEERKMEEDGGGKAGGVRVRMKWLVQTR